MLQATKENALQRRQSTILCVLKLHLANVFSGIFLQCFTVDLLPPPFFKTHYLHSSLFKFETNETCGQLNLLSGHETAVQFFSSVPSVQS